VSSSSIKSVIVDGHKQVAAVIVVEVTACTATEHGLFTCIHQVETTESHITHGSLGYANILANGIAVQDMHRNSPH